MYTDCGVTEQIYNYSRVKVTATCEKYIAVPTGEDIDTAVDTFIDSLDLSDFEYDYDIVSEESEAVYVREV